MYHIFIAHAKEDQHTAGQLAHRLRTMRLPKNLIRDQARVIDHSLYTNAPDCHNILIVLCSFHSVHDTTVEQQIRTFHEEAPQGQIIPYVCSGIPHAADPKNECIPDILQHLYGSELLAINPLETGLRIGFLRLIATIYHLPPDQLIQRSQQQSRRRILCLCLVILLVGGYIFFSEYTTYAHKEYYRSYTYRNSIPLGIDRIYLPIGDYYEFSVYAQGTDQVTQIRTVGNPKPPQADADSVSEYLQAINAPCIRFCYHSDNTLDAMILYDESGSIRFVMHFGGEMSTVNFSTAPDGITPYFPLAERNCSCFRLTYDSQGQLQNIDGCN